MQLHSICCSPWVHHRYNILVPNPWSWVEDFWWWTGLYKASCVWKAATSSWSCLNIWKHMEVSFIFSFSYHISIVINTSMMAEGLHQQKDQFRPIHLMKASSYLPPRPPEPAFTVRELSLHMAQPIYCLYTAQLQFLLPKTVVIPDGWTREGNASYIQHSPERYPQTAQFVCDVNANHRMQ